MEEEEGEMVVHVAMEMSLDEWKALQETSRPKAEFNIRKAEDKIPSKAKVIHQSKYMEVRIKSTLWNLFRRRQQSPDQSGALMRPYVDCLRNK